MEDLLNNPKLKYMSSCKLLYMNYLEDWERNSTSARYN